MTADQFVFLLKSFACYSGCAGVFCVLLVVSAGALRK